MSKSWHVVKTEVPQTEGDFASHLLHEMGCNGAVEEPAVDKNWVRLTAYFDASNQGRDALQRCIKLAFAPFPGLAKARIDIATCAMDDWCCSWRQWFRPFAIVPGIVVAPSWEKYLPGEGESVITVDPGMAFGTGLHPTTQLCAKAICDAVQERPTSLLDVGTGSGLLALIGHRLNIERIVAVETDRDASKVAGENFAINDSGDIQIVDSLSQVNGEFNIVVANILLLTLLELGPELIRHTSPGGRLILSGITPEQEATIQSAFPLRLAESRRQDDWSLMTFVRKD